MKEIRVFIRVDKVEEGDMDFIDEVLSSYFNTEEIFITVTEENKVEE